MLLKIKEKKKVQAIYSVVMTWSWNLHGFSILGKGSLFFNVFRRQKLEQWLWFAWWIFPAHAQCLGDWDIEVYLKVMTDTCKQTDIDKNVIWNQISAFLAIQLLLMANSPELAAKYINPQCDGQAVLRGNMIRALFTSCFDVTLGVNGVISNLH